VGHSELRPSAEGNVVEWSSPTKGIAIRPSAAFGGVDAAMP